jgi:hypothetical protein
MFLFLVKPSSSNSVALAKPQRLASSLVGHVAGGILFGVDGFEAECWWIRFELQ